MQNAVNRTSVLADVGHLAATDPTVKAAAGTAKVLLTVVKAVAKAVVMATALAADTPKADMAAVKAVIPVVETAVGTVVTAIANLAQVAKEIADHVRIPVKAVNQRNVLRV